MPPAGASLTATFAIPQEAITVNAAPPELLSQHNVEAHTGVPARAFLEYLRAPGFPLSVSKLGKLRLVDRAAFVAWLRARANAPEPPADDGGDLLEELGLQRAARRR